MEQQISFDNLELLLVISDIAHGIGTLKGVCKVLEILKHEDIESEKLQKILSETERRLASAQGNLMRHYVQGESID